MDFQQLLILKNQPPRQGTKVLQRPLIRRICLCHLQHCGTDTADAAASGSFDRLCRVRRAHYQGYVHALVGNTGSSENGKSFSI